MTAVQSNSRNCMSETEVYGDITTAIGPKGLINLGFSCDV